MRKNLLLIAFLLSNVIAYSQSWTMQNSAFTLTGTYPFDISVVDPNVVWAVGRDGSGSNTGIQEFTRTVDGGNLWTAGLVTTDTNLQFSGISAVSDSVAYAMMFNNTAQAGGGVFKTRDGGASWVQSGAGSIFDANSFPDIIYFIDELHGVAIGDPNNGYFEIYLTADSGATWTRIPQINITNPLANEFAIVNDYAVYGTSLWFGTDHGRVYRTTNAGLNWTAATCGPAANTITALAFATPMNGLAISTTAAGASTVYRSTDGGASWSLITPTGPIFKNTIKNMPGTFSLLSCGASTAGRGSSYSTDFGSTWVLIDTSGAGTTDGYTEMEFLDSNTGWAGGFTVDPSTDGMYKYVPGGPLSVPSIVKSEADLTVYPNPSSGQFSLRLNQQIKADLSIQLFDLFGKVVYSEILNDASGVINRTVNVPNLAKGIYTLRTESGNSSSVSKVIVQ
jgi:photosystem II stability/assembly factor-like uncharacterized protein